MHTCILPGLYRRRVERQHTVSEPPSIARHGTYTSFFPTSKDTELHISTAAFHTHHTTVDCGVLDTGTAVYMERDTMGRVDTSGD